MAFSAKSYNVNMPSMSEYSGNVQDYNYIENNIEELDYESDDKNVESFDLSNDMSKNALYVSDALNDNTVLIRTGATLGVGVISVFEGLFKFGEALVDTAAIVDSVIKTPFTYMADKAFGLFGVETNLTDKLWDNTKSFVSTEHVKSAFDTFYDSGIGQTLKEESYGFDTTRSIGNMVGYTGGVLLTGGLGSAALGGTAVSATATGFISPTVLGVTAGTAGISTHASDAWNDGASTTEGLAYGAAGGLWEGVQWYAGSKISQIGGWGDELGNILGGTAKSRMISRIGLDSVDGGLEGFVQPALSKIYKDESYGELFEEAGGWKNVGIQTAIAGGMSALGEIKDYRKYLKTDFEDALRKEGFKLENNSSTMLQGTKISIDPIIDIGGEKYTIGGALDANTNIVTKGSKHIAEQLTKPGSELTAKDISFISKYADAAGIKYGDLSTYTPEELTNLIAKSQFIISGNAIRKSVNGELIYEDAGKYLVEDVSGHDVTGIKVFVDASVNPDNEYIYEVVLDPTKDKTAKHLMVKKPDTVALKIEDQIKYEVKREMVLFKFDTDHDDIMDSIFKEMEKNGIPLNLKEYGKQSREQKNKNIEFIMNSIKQSLKDNFDKRIVDPEYRSLANDYIDEIVDSQGFKDLINNPSKRVPSGLLPYYLKGNDMGYKQTLKELCDYIKNY